MGSTDSNPGLRSALVAQYKNCRKAGGPNKGDWTRGCYVYGLEWFYSPTRSVNEGSNLAKAQRHLDPSFSLLSTREVAGKRNLTLSVTSDELVAADLLDPGSMK